MQDAEQPSPFWAGKKAALREMLPRGLVNSPEVIRTDVAHTYAICGMGKDDLASCLIFISVYCGAFGAGTWEAQLDKAFDSFANYLIKRGKTSSILNFKKEELKIASLPSCIPVY